MKILSTTKIYKNYQTAIPKEIRKKFDVNKDTIIEWGIDKNGEPKIKFRKKVTVDDVIGIIDDDDIRNSVELKRSIY